MAERITTHKQLRVFQTAMETAMEIYKLSKAFPAEERFSMTDQIRRSSRSVCANLAEAWRRHRYPAAFVAKLSDAEAEASETQVWIGFAEKCNYLSPETAPRLEARYDQIIAQLVKMSDHPGDWIIPDRSQEPRES